MPRPPTPLPPPRGQLLPQPQRATPVYYLASPSRTDHPTPISSVGYSPLYLRVVSLPLVVPTLPIVRR